MLQTDAFNDISNVNPEFCPEKHKQILQEKISSHQEIVKKSKKLLKQINAMADKKKQIQRYCSDIEGCK